MVSAADKLHNARAILADLRELKKELWLRFKGGKGAVLEYYPALVDAFSEGAAKQPAGLRRLVGELKRVVEELQRVAETT